MVIWEMLFRTALRTIKNNYGQVCEKYDQADGCGHESCQSSYSAWAIANQALEMYEHRDDVKDEVDKRKEEAQRGQDGEHQEAGETGC